MVCDCHKIGVNPILKQNGIVGHIEVRAVVCHREINVDTLNGVFSDESDLSSPKVFAGNISACPQMSCF